MDTSLQQSPRTKLLKTPRAILLFFVKYFTLCSYLSFIEHYSEVWVLSLRGEVVFLFYFNFLSHCLSLWLFVLYPTLKLTFQPCFAAPEYVDALFFKKSTRQCRSHQRLGFDPWVQKIPWRRKSHTIPVLLPEGFLGQRRLVDCGLQGCKESDMNEHLSTWVDKEKSANKALFP